MATHSDLLYSIFERFLFNALVEDETSDALVLRVVSEYIAALSRDGGMIPRSHLQSVEADLREEVFEMLRKKTYGHYNLTEFRKAHGAKIKEEPTTRAKPSAEKTKTRRTRRAC